MDSGYRACSNAMIETELYTKNVSFDSFSFWFPFQKFFLLGVVEKVM